MKIILNMILQKGYDKYINNEDGYTLFHTYMGKDSKYNLVYSKYQ